MTLNDTRCLSARKTPQQERTQLLSLYRVLPEVQISKNPRVPPLSLYKLAKDQPPVKESGATKPEAVPEKSLPNSNREQKTKIDLLIIHKEFHQLYQNLTEGNPALMEPPSRAQGQACNTLELGVERHQLGQARSH